MESHIISPTGLVDLRRALFSPDRVVLVGASNDPQKLSGRPIAFLKRFGYRGEIVPVNPFRDAVQGLPAIPSVEQLESSADLALIATSASEVAPTLELCALKGIPAAVVFASGFAEQGAAGAQLQVELAEVIERTGIRVLGPNCLGLISVREGLTATFTSGLQQVDELRSGPVALVSQSGAFGTFLMSALQNDGIGLDYFANTGNEVDLSVPDLLDTLVDDDDIHVLLAYVEGVKKPEALLSVAARAAELGKPLVLVKAGRSDDGARAAASHSGSLAMSDDVFDAAAASLGIIRVSGADELIDATKVFLPRRSAGGNRLSVVTISGGAGILATDAANDDRLEMAVWDPEWKSRLGSVLPSYISPSNPIDAAGIEPFGPAFELAAQHPGSDVVLGVLGNSDDDAELLVASMTSTWRTHADRLLAVSWTGGNGRAVRALTEEGIPVFSEPARATHALSLVVRHSAFLAAHRRNRSADVVDGRRREQARSLLRSTSGALSFAAAAELLALYDIPAPAWRIVETAEDAVVAARQIGGQVSVKLDAEEVQHKSELSAVDLRLESAEEVRASADRMLGIGREAGATRPRVLVQAMADGGVEVIVGVVRDPVFGPVVVCGMGGILTELLKDRALLLPPFDRTTALDALQSLRGAPLFDGFRGAPAVDIEAGADIVHRVGQLAREIGDLLEEFDLNPVILARRGSGAMAVDALAIVRAGL